MKDLLSKKSLQPLYAVLILLVLFCAAPIIRGPRGFGLHMYLIIKGGVESASGYYIWLNIIVSAIFVGLAVPALRQLLDERVESLVRLIGSGFLVLFMIFTILQLKGLAWGWGLWMLIILNTLLALNVYLNFKSNYKK